MKGGKTTKVQQGLDPASQTYVNAQRGAATNAATMAMDPTRQFFTGPITDAQITGAMNPYLENVVGGVRGEFDHLRGQAMVGTNQDATMSGAFGGSRHGIAEATRLAELDRSQGQTIAGLLNTGYQDARGFAEHQRALTEQQMRAPLFGAQQGLNFFNQGMGPVGMSSTTNEKGNADPFGTIIGAGLAGAGMYFGARGGGGGGGAPPVGQSGFAPFNPYMQGQRGLFG
jgi:hypothetical protein